MKIYSLRLCVMIANLLFSSLALTAQTKDNTENTKEKIIEQFKKGTAPGLKFAPVTTMLQSKKEDNKNEAEYTRGDLKRGKGDNIKTSESGGANAVTSQVDNSNSKLISDRKPELKIKDSITVNRVIPTQEAAQESQQKKQE